MVVGASDGSACVCGWAPDGGAVGLPDGVCRYMGGGACHEVRVQECKKWYIMKGVDGSGCIGWVSVTPCNRDQCSIYTYCTIDLE